MGDRLGWKILGVIAGCLLEILWLRVRKHHPVLPKISVRP